MRLTELFPSDLLKSQDVIDEGGEMTLTISKVEMKTFDRDDGKKETKPIVYFEEGKQLVLNVTNKNTISELHGQEDTDQWLGKQVTLTVKDVEFQGKSVLGIRVKNLNSKDALIQEFWESAKALGYDQKAGQALLKEHDMDFAAATKALEF